MYQPLQHREDRLEVQHELIQTHPLGLLISISNNELVANALPFLLKSQSPKLGTLQAHMARANGQWRDLDGQQVLVVFQGPQNYISPSHYETKRETGKVVPTWNYVMVQVRGFLRLRDDQAWLEKQIANLTSHHESKRVVPWAVTDAPQDYIASQLRGIVGLEVEITAIEGKWKVSQNRQEADRNGVAAGLLETNPEMAEIVKQYGKR